jgi:hypothetical protein
MALTEAQAFEIGQRVANENGAWVELVMYPHPSNFYFVYGFKHWAPDFAPEIGHAESATHLSRTKIERQMRNWLKNR